MAPDAPDDSGEFYSFTWLLVREVFEEEYLHLVPAGGVDGLPSGDRRHGPWDPARCSEVLVRWHELGLIELHAGPAGGQPPTPPRPSRPRWRRPCSATTRAGASDRSSPCARATRSSTSPTPGWSSTRRHPRSDGPDGRVSHAPLRG